MISPDKNLTLFCDKKSKRYTEKGIKSIKFLSDSTVAVTDNPTVVVDTKTSAYAIYDVNGKLVPESLQYRGKNHQFIPKVIPQDAPYIDADAVLVGRVYPHFGHFLIEHLNRLYGGMGKSNKLKWVFIDNLNIGAPKYIFDFMRAFGVKKQDVIILTQSTRFRKIYIPSQTLNVASGWISKKMISGYRAMANNTVGSGYDKVYMSRTKLPENMRTYGEEQIQKIFAKNGFKIIYPETMTIAEQIASVADAKYLAGCAGTALHWALFMQPGGTVISLKRNSKNDKFARTQYMLNTMSGLNSVFVWSSIEQHKSRHGGQHAPQIIGVTEYLKQFFDEFKFKYSAKDIAFDNAVMNKYMTEYEKYAQEHGGTLRRTLLRHFIKVISCFVPGRVNRKKVRNWLKRKLHV